MRKPPLFALVFLIITLVLVSLNYSKRPTLKLDLVFNSFDGHMSVNDSLILIKSWEKGIVIDKESLRVMNLGLDPSLGDGSENECQGSKSFHLNSDSIIETKSCEFAYIQTVHDINSFSSSSSQHSYDIGYQFLKLNPYNYNDQGVDLGSPSYFYYDTIYSVLDDQLYKENILLSEDKILNYQFAIDGDEMFFLNSEKQIKRLFEGTEEVYIPSLADSFFITEENLYYADKSQNKVFGYDRKKENIFQIYDIDELIKVRDFQGLIFISNHSGLHIYNGKELYLYIPDALDFDIDQDYVYTIDVDNKITRTNLETLEGETIYAKTGN